MGILAWNNLQLLPICTCYSTGNMNTERTPESDFVQLADRMSRLPAYVFGEINRIKYGKRREGVDIIDMAMGNPTDPTPQNIVDKL